jgi:hypothetical protein
MLVPIPLTDAAPQLDAAVAQRAATAYTCAVAENLAPSRHFIVADMSRLSSDDRLWVFDMRDPKHPVLVARMRVAHGAGSDPGKTGRAVRFGNAPESGETSLGLYRVAEPYVGVHGKSYRLDGLTPGFNTLARERAVVLHPAAYVRDSGPIGRSLGCPAIGEHEFSSLDRRGVLEDALVWIDGPDVALQHSASLRCPSKVPEPVRFCRKDDAGWTEAASANAWTRGAAWAG